MSAASRWRWSGNIQFVADSMRRPHPIQTVLDRIDQTLKAGHDVYVVGFALTNRGAVPPTDLPAAPAHGSDWTLWPYVRRWTMQIAYTVQTHGAHGKVVPVHCGQSISVAEDVHAIVVNGWKDTQVAAAAP